MARKPRPPARPSPQLPHTDEDGNHVCNEILLQLPREEYDLVRSKLEFVRLKTHHVLHEPGDTLKKELGSKPK
jgi:hypothetical protein